MRERNVEHYAEDLKLAVEGHILIEIENNPSEVYVWECKVEEGVVTLACCWNLV